MKHTELYITYNAEMVFPNEECRSHFMELLEPTRDAYNECAKIIYNNRIPLDIKSVHNAVYSHLRSSYPKLTSNAVVAIYRNVMGAIRSIKSNKHEDAKIPEKTNLNHKLNRYLYNRLTAEGVCQPPNRTVSPLWKHLGHYKPTPFRAWRS